MTKPDIIELHAIVQGIVQGVGFRATTRHLATQLGLKGHVRNCHDGSVEIIAQGTREQVDELLSRLKSSSGLGRIDSVEIEYRSPSVLIDTFRVEI